MTGLHPYYNMDLINKERAEEKAAFCLATGVAPSEYDNLTQYEINAFIKEANRRAKEANKK